MGRFFIFQFQFRIVEPAFSSLFNKYLTCFSVQGCHSLVSLPQIMDRLKSIIFKLLVILISLLFADGGRSMSLVSDNIKVIMNHEHPADLEVPHQHLTINFSTEEKWIESPRFDFCCINTTPIRFLYLVNPPSGDFSDTIWQPPKTV
jgi:hypothetical protein